MSRSLKSDYIKVVNAYMDAFCKKQGLTMEHWVAGDIGGICCFGDVLFFSFDQIRIDIDNKFKKGVIIDWLYEMIDTNPTKQINYYSYAKGLRIKK